MYFIDKYLIVKRGERIHSAIQLSDKIRLIRKRRSERKNVRLYTMDVYDVWKENIKI